MDGTFLVVKVAARCYLERVKYVRIGNLVNSTQQCDLRFSINFLLKRNVLRNCRRDNTIKVVK